MPQSYFAKRISPKRRIGCYSIKEARKDSLWRKLPKEEPARVVFSLIGLHFFEFEILFLQSRILSFEIVDMAVEISLFDIEIVENLYGIRSKKQATYIHRQNYDHDGQKEIAKDRLPKSPLGQKVIKLFSSLSH
jgi:hypothetical protein